MYFRTQPGVPTTTMVVFGEWLPDDDRNIEPGRMIFWLNGAPVPLQDAKNVIYTGSSYRPFGTPVAQGAALPVVPVDAFTAYYGGTDWLIAGSGSALYYSKDGGTTWTACGSGFTGTGWVFAQYGNCVYATNGKDPIQTMDLSAGTPAFTALNATSAPVAFAIGVIRDFVVAGNIVSGDVTGAWVLQWSALANPSVWSLPNTQDARANQSGAQSEYSQYGAIQYIAQGEEMAMVFQETGIVRVQYVGGNEVFSFYTFERKRGLLTPRAAAQVDNSVYFLSADGFYATDGSQVDPIGYSKVNRYFLADCTDLTKVRAAVDTLNHLIVWNYPNASGTAQLCYNFAEKRWTRGAYTVGTLYQGMSGTQYQPQLFNSSTGTASALQFATGNGATSTFTLTGPSGATLSSANVSALHQTDWQDRIALSNQPRKNTVLNSALATGASVNNCTLGTTSGPAPDGSATVGTLTVTATTAPQIGPSSSLNPDAGNNLNFSCSVASQASGFVAIQLNQNDSTGAFAASFITVNLANGAVGVEQAIIGTNGFAVAVSQAVAGWYRVTVSCPLKATVIGVNWYLGISNSATSRDGTVSAVLKFYGMCDAKGAYIPTTSGPVTVTDYTQAGNQITFGQVPAVGAIEDWDGTYTDWNVNTFSGAVTDCELTTKDFRFDPSAHALVTSVRVLCDNASATAGVAARDQDSDAQNFVGYLSPETISRAVSVRADGYMHAVNVKIPGAFTYCQGVAPEYVLRGSR